jgi:hypothetical protein
VVERSPGDHWSVIARGRTAPAQQEVAASLLDQLHRLKGSKIVEDPMTNPQRFGMVRPNLSAVLYDRSGMEIGGINVAELEATLPPGAAIKAPPRTFGYATSSADQAVYEILGDQVVDLENTASTLQAAVEPKPAAPANPSPSATGTALPARPASAVPSATVPATP